MRSNKGNAVLIVLFVILILVFLLQFIRVSPTEKAVDNPAMEAQSRVDWAYQKSFLLGAHTAMEKGLSPYTPTWFCNKPIPPPISEANASLRNESTEALKMFRKTLQEEGYLMRYGDFDYNISFPMTSMQDIEIPGDVVIVTDLSGSMSHELGNTGQKKDDVVRETNRILIENVFNKTPGARIGLISYDEGATIDMELTGNKTRLFNVLYSEAYDAPDSGYTCIACGIYEAVKLLVPPPPPSDMPDRPLSIILMSDGGANKCFLQGSVSNVCRLMNHTCTNPSDRSDSKTQAIEYASQANTNYNVTIYTVVFEGDTSICASTVPPTPITDCYDPVTMQAIANNANGLFREGDNQSALTEIYKEFANESAKTVTKSYRYLKLENDRLVVDTPYLLAGLNTTDMVAAVNFTKGKFSPYSLRTWYMYKGVVNWMIITQHRFFRIGKLEERLVEEKPCQAVWQNSSFSCTGRMIDNKTLNRMKVNAKDLDPQGYVKKLEQDLNDYLKSNFTNITCSMRLKEMNLTNLPLFHYSTNQPPNTPLNTPFGTGKFRQTGDSSGSRMTACPQDSGRDDFLGIPSPYLNGTWGVNTGPLTACSPSRPYEQIGVDRRAYLQIETRCVDMASKYITDGKYAPTSPRLKFEIVIDMMNDCDPPALATTSITC
ncbi:MAG: vWA domain-containing protein [Nanobdellota archaeon]